MKKSYQGNPGIAILHLIKSATEGEKPPIIQQELRSKFQCRKRTKEKRLLCNCYNPKQREISSVKPHQNIWTLGLLSQCQ